MQAATPLLRAGIAVLRVQGGHVLATETARLAERGKCAHSGSACRRALNPEDRSARGALRAASSGFGRLKLLHHVAREPLHGSLNPAFTAEVASSLLRQCMLTGGEDGDSFAAGEAPCFDPEHRSFHVADLFKNLHIGSLVETSHRGMPLEIYGGLSQNLEGADK